MEQVRYHFIRGNGQKVKESNKYCTQNTRILYLDKPYFLYNSHQSPAKLLPLPITVYVRYKVRKTS